MIPPHEAVPYIRLRMLGLFVFYHGVGLLLSRHFLHEMQQPLTAFLALFVFSLVGLDIAVVYGRWAIRREVQKFHERLKGGRDGGA